jgi:hypothetical protein
LSYTDGTGVAIFNDTVRIDFVAVTNPAIVSAFVVLKQLRICDEISPYLEPTEYSNVSFFECPVINSVDGSQQAVKSEK